MNLLDQIETMRKKLNQVASQHKLSDDEVIRISQELDRLILEYIRLRRSGEQKLPQQSD